MSLVQVCKTSDVADGEIFLVEVDGAGKVAIYNVGGEFFATADTCTHGAASLSEDGYLDDHTVTCSWHDGTFDIRTGEPTALPCNVPLKTYPVTVDGEAISRSEERRVGKE